MFTIRDFAKKAIEIRPDDASVHHLLGRLSFGVANISWMERKIASALFGEPPQITLEETLGHFLKARQYRENFHKNELWVGNTFAKLGNKESAREAYQNVINFPTISEDDRVTQEEAKKLIKKL